MSAKESPFSGGALNNGSVVHMSNYPKNATAVHAVKIREIVAGDSDLDTDPIADDVFLALEFQRPAYWSESQMSEYIDTIMRYLPLQAIEMIDVANTLNQFAKNLDPTSVDKYEEVVLKHGCSILSLDGNNRYVTFKMFYNNEVKWKPNKNYVCEQDGIAYGKQYYKEGVYFKDLPPVLKKSFLNREILHCAHSGLSIMKVHETFKRYHLTGAMYPAEIRNSIMTDTCKYIREKATDVLENLAAVIVSLLTL
jgi:hypothetical protein